MGMATPPPISRKLSQIGDLYTAEFVEWNGLLEVNTEAHDGRRAAVPVVGGVGRMLVVDSQRDPAPHVGREVGLENLLQAIGQRAIAQDETQSSQSQIAPVVAGEPVYDVRHSHFVLRTAPMACHENRCRSRRSDRVPYRRTIQRPGRSTPGAQSPLQRSLFLLGVQVESHGLWSPLVLRTTPSELRSRVFCDGCSAPANGRPRYGGFSRFRRTS